MVDEAANDFLSVYNPAVSEIRAWLGVPFPPSFEFGEWIAGLTVAVLVLFALSALAYRGARPAVRLAYPYAGLMLLNGLGHTTGSIVTGGVLPGTWSAPPLLAASAWLLVSARRV